MDDTLHNPFILGHIMSFLGTISLVHCRSVCKMFRYVSNDDDLWEYLHNDYYNTTRPPIYYLSWKDYMITRLHIDRWIDSIVKKLKDDEIMPIIRHRQCGYCILYNMRKILTKKDTLVYKVIRQRCEKCAVCSISLLKNKQLIKKRIVRTSKNLNFYYLSCNYLEEDGFIYILAWNHTFQYVYVFLQKVKYFDN